MLIALRESFQRNSRLQLFLRSWLLHHRLFGHWLLGAFPASDKSQSIGRVEWELTNRGLARRAQSDVHAAIARQPDRQYVPENPRALFCRELSVALHLTFDLFIGQVMFLAKRFGVDAGFGNSLLDEEGLGAGDATLGERLIEFDGAALIRVTSKNQARIRFALEIRLEVGSQSDQRLLLTHQQTAFWIRDHRLVGDKVDAVQREPFFQTHDLRVHGRRWRVFQRQLRGRLAGQTARVSATRAHRHVAG